MADAASAIATAYRLERSKQGHAASLRSPPKPGCCPAEDRPADHATRAHGGSKGPPKKRAPSPASVARRVRIGARLLTGERLELAGLAEALRDERPGEEAEAGERIGQASSG